MWKGKASVTFRVTLLLGVRQCWASLQRTPVAGIPYLLALSKSSLNGVLGVECSNHSVPTILFNDLAQLLRVGLFHVRDFCGTSPRFMPQICLFCPPPPACQPTMLCLPLRLVAQPLGRLTGDACRWSCIRFSRTATARRGSESMRSFWQFKSFPVSMPFKHF